MSILFGLEVRLPKSTILTIVRFLFSIGNIYKNQLTKTLCFVCPHKGLKKPYKKSQTLQLFCFCQRQSLPKEAANFCTFIASFFRAFFDALRRLCQKTMPHSIIVIIVVLLWVHVCLRVSDRQSVRREDNLQLV